MSQSFFIWNNRDCRSMGVRMRGPAPIIRPEERVQHIEIPGRSGDLTQLQGENIYNSYIQTVTFTVTGGFRVREVYKWLRGSG
jgi:phenylacetate-coenzyme A ligase PaaK-like adenylate-forming protein